MIEIFKKTRKIYYFMLTEKLVRRKSNPVSAKQPVTRDGLSRAELLRWQEAVYSGSPVPVELQRWPDANASESLFTSDPSRTDSSEQNLGQSPQGPKKHLIYTRSSDPSSRRVLHDFGYRPE
jgi:hypothetical protein